MHGPRCRAGADHLVVPRGSSGAGRWRRPLSKRSANAWASRRRGIGRIWRSAGPLLQLLGLFSLVTLFAHQRTAPSTAPSTAAVRRTAWYDKPRPTFCDALALVRKELWAQETFRGSPLQDDMVKVPREFVERLTDVVCYAA